MALIFSEMPKMTKYLMCIFAMSNVISLSELLFEVSLPI